MTFGRWGALVVIAVVFAWTPQASAQHVNAGTDPPIQISGVYPHLTMRNNENECGIGAVVAWQGELCVITYGPHKPNGSSDKLYQITPDLELKIFAESVGGTPANRMIHEPSNQLLIGPYLIDSNKKVRTIPPSKMYGRLTGNARHLTDPNLVYYATMEEGLYAVDVNTLDVTCLIRDGNSGSPKKGINSKLPGYHGKGLYSGQGRVVYSNNGEHGSKAAQDPTIPSGSLAQWFGKGDWQLVRRNQFTEITGPGGIFGNANPETDPIWAMGWDAKSVILALLEDSTWHYYRLPKASHSYDGAHGWNTEWPRIRDIGEAEMMATMHGTFWRFPKTFSKNNSAGITPRSNYLKVVGDFCIWNEKIVLGCDDSARAEFLNTRSFKAKQAAPKQSNSNLWFLDPQEIDELGPAIGRGSVWLREDVDANTISDSFLFNGYDFQQLHLHHKSKSPVTFLLETDRDGQNQWNALTEIVVEPGQSVSRIFKDHEKAAWIRLTAKQEASQVTANFQFRNRDRRTNRNHSMFDGIASPNSAKKTLGLMRSLAFDKLGIAASTDGGNSLGYYVLDQQMKLRRVDDESAAENLVREVQQPARSYRVDRASVVIEEDGARYRLPLNQTYLPSSNLEAGGQNSLPKSLADCLANSLAKNAVCTASSTHENFSSLNAVDGKLGDNSRWISNKEGAVLELALEGEKTFRSIWVVTGWKEDKKYCARNFDIEVKLDGEWVTVPGGNIRGNNQIEKEIVLDQPVSTSSVRIVSKDDDHFRLYEIALFENVLDIQRVSSSYQTARVCREVATERDLLNIHGTFYELPARNAQGLAKLRPIAAHNLSIHDYCSHGGLFLITGIEKDAKGEHIFRSDDGAAAVWAGVVDDLWKLGKPRGQGGPWYSTKVEPNVPSDPYLMTAYDRKSVKISASDNAKIRIEIDVDGTGLWIPYKTFDLEPNKQINHTFPEGFSAYWIRAVCDSETTATTLFTYQ